MVVSGPWDAHSQQRQSVYDLAYQDRSVFRRSLVARLRSICALQGEGDPGAAAALAGWQLPLARRSLAARFAAMLGQPSRSDDAYHSVWLAPWLHRCYCFAAALDPEKGCGSEPRPRAQGLQPLTTAAGWTDWTCFAG